MINLRNKYCNCKLIEKDDSFTLKGRISFGKFVFYYIFYSIGLAAFYDMLFSLKDLNISSTLITALALLLVLLSVNVKIKINKNEAIVMLKLWIIPLYYIKSKTKKLIIDDDRLSDLKIISDRKDGYNKDLKNHLEFSYIEPMDGTYHIFYIDYNHKSKYIFEVCCDSYFWENLIKGLKKLDAKTE